MTTAEDSYLFRHASVRDAAYELQPPSQRARLHGHVVDSVADLDDAELEAWADDLADHARLAQVTRRTSDTAMLQRYAELEHRFLLLGEKHARANYDLGRRLELNQRLAEHELSSDLQRAHAHFYAGQCLQIMGRLEAALAQLSQARDLAEGLADKGVLAEILTNIGVHHLDRGEFESAQDAMHRVAAISDDSDLPEMRVRARFALARFHDGNGDIEQAERYYRETIELARAADLGEREAIALINIGGLLQEAGRTEPAREALERAAQLLEGLNHDRALAVCIGNLGWLQENEREIEQAEKTLQRAAGIARRVGSIYDEAVILGNLGNVFAAQGRFEQALKTFETALDYHREVGTRRHEGIVCSDMSLVLEQLGRHEDALEHCRQGIEIGNAMHNPRGEQIARANMGRLLTKRGRYKEARAELERALAMAEERADTGWVISVQSRMVELFLAAGDAESTRAWFDRTCQTYAANERQVPDGWSMLIQDGLAGLETQSAADAEE